MFFSVCKIKSGNLWMARLQSCLEGCQLGSLFTELTRHTLYNIGYWNKTPSIYFHFINQELHDFWIITFSLETNGTLPSNMSTNSFEHSRNSSASIVKSAFFLISASVIRIHQNTLLLQLQIIQSVNNYTANIF